MKTLPLAWRLLLRDWKSGELALLWAALTIAVTAMTGVAFLTDRVGQAVKLRAAESLAADLRLGSSQPLPAAYLQLAHRAGLETATMVSLPSVVFAGQRNTLSAVRAVSAAYPLRGKLRVAAKLLAKPTATAAIPPPGEAWASPRLLARLDADTGTTITLGNTHFKITRVLSFSPDEGWRFADLAPTLLINIADLKRTGLVQPGSRVSYRQLFAGSRSEVRAFKPVLKARLSGAERLSDIEDTNPQIRSAMERAGRFLNLASIISVLLAAIAVAMTTRRYAVRHRDRVALFKCLGSQQALILRLSLLQLLMLALLAAIAGTMLGYLAQQLLAVIARDLLAQALPPPGPAPMVLGLVTAVVIVSGFALPELIQMSRTPVLRVLRQDVEPPPLRYGISYVAGAAAVLVLLQWLLGDPRLVVSLAAGMAAMLVILGLAGLLLVKLGASFRGMVGVSWHYGLANLSRRARDSVIQVVAFGLGLMVLILLTLARNDLMESWRASLPANTPNQFMINVQPSEVSKLRDFFSANDLPLPHFVPLVRARMTAINGKDVKQLRFEDPRGERWAKRESNLSYTGALPAGNRLTAGRWWQADTTAHEISVEEDFGRELGIGLGDEISFNIAGESVSATVTSFRSVEWDSFTPNFFMEFTPATLQGFPATYISSVYLTPGNKHKAVDLMRAFPSVTVIDLDAILSQVRDVMNKASLAVETVFLFTLLAGLAVLWAALLSSRDERRFESAILRTLGASRRQVFAGVAAEFAAIGLLAGLLASSGAGLIAWHLAVNVFDLPYHFNPAIWLSGPLLGLLIVGGSGLLATRSVVAHAPLSVLRAH
ncbi:MAG: FtsX-like permease family protein [Lysobacterales bacterium]